MQRQQSIDRPLPPRCVVIVGGGPAVLAQIEPLLPERAYEVQFVETCERPYGLIRGGRPDVVVLCLRMEDHEGFQLLSMLQTDPATRSIPVLTCTAEYEGHVADQVFDSEPADPGPQVQSVPRPSRH